MKKFSNNQKIVYTGVLGALGFILYIIQIPWPLVPYLSIDFSEVVVLVALTMSIQMAFTVALIKVLLVLILMGSDIVGLSAMFLGSCTLIISYSILSKFCNKYIASIFSTLLFTIILTTANFFIITPLYSGQPLSEMIQKYGGISSYLSYILTLYVPFNITKGIAVFAMYQVLAKYLLNTNKSDEIRL